MYEFNDRVEKREERISVLRVDVCPRHTSNSVGMVGAFLLVNYSSRSPLVTKSG